MGHVTTLLIAVVVILFHVWASRRSPKYWYLGGIIPLLWAGCIVFLLAHRAIHWAEDWKTLVFPTLLLLLLWLQGNQSAKKREMAQMQAKDL